MKTCFKTFKTGVDELTEFLSTTENEIELIGLLLQRKDILNDNEKKLLNKIAEARTDRKRYIYSVAIVSLYGLFERFINAIVESFISNIASSVGSYKSMPAKIRKNHIQMSIALVKAIGEDRHRIGLTQETVIANLHSCLSDNKNFRVNGEAFVLHRGNISLVKVAEFLSSLGIENCYRRISLSPPFISFFSKIDPERDIRGIADQDLKALLQPIDELVDRRNQVSHGVIDDIQSTDLLKEMCGFVTAFCDAIYYLMLQDLLKYKINCTGVYHLGKPIKVFNNSIACFEIHNKKISIGNIIVAETCNNLEPYRYSKIESLQIDGNPVQEIDSNQPVTFGAKVSFQASGKHNYYILPMDMI